MVNNISSNSGSLEGGTILTIDGEYFNEASWNPLVVNVGDEPCTVLSAERNMIQCQTSTVPIANRNHYHGKALSKYDLSFYKKVFRWSWSSYLPTARIYYSGMCDTHQLDHC